jgi:hypothetical protein
MDREALFDGTISPSSSRTSIDRGRIAERAARPGVLVTADAVTDALVASIAKHRHSPEKPIRRASEAPRLKTHQHKENHHG